MNTRSAGLVLLCSGVVVRAEAQTPMPVSLLQPLVEIQYHGAAPAGIPPSYTDLTVDEDGSLSSHSQSPPGCQHLSRAQVKSLTHLLNEASVRKALTSSQLQDSSKVPFPKLIVIRHSSTYAFSALNTPEPIQRFVRAVDTAVAASHCKVPVPGIASQLAP